MDLPAAVGRAAGLHIWSAAAPLLRQLSGSRGGRRAGPAVKVKLAQDLDWRDQVRFGGMKIARRPGLGTDRERQLLL